MSEQLARLLDEQRIVDVAVRYCWALDTRNWAGLDTVFAPDATAKLASRSVLEGLDAIVRRCTAVLSPLDASQHLVSTHQVHLDGDRATHRCNLHAQHVRAAAEGGPNYVVGGRYEDDLVRTAEGWRIRHRRLVVLWTEGNLAVVQPTTPR